MNSSMTGSREERDRKKNTKKTIEIVKPFSFQLDTFRHRVTARCPLRNFISVQNSIENRNKMPDFVLPSQLKIFHKHQKRILKPQIFEMEAHRARIKANFV